MASLARVVTVDPTGTIAQIVRAAIDLAGHPVIQIDVPDGEEALDFVERRECRLVVTELRLNGSGHGIDLAQAVKDISPETAVIVLAAPDDPDTIENDFPDATFAYLHRPIDPAQFMRLFKDGLEGRNFSTAAPNTAPVSNNDDTLTDLGPIPQMDLKAAERVIDLLLTDVGAMAIVLANRAGSVLLERGAVGYLDREELANALLPMTRTNFDMGQLVGGQPAALHFYDGETFDVFVLSVGFHHFMCLVFDGQMGNRQFGAVNRFGRRAAEDLVTILGIGAYSYNAPQEDEDEPQHHPVADEELVEEIEDAPIARAEDWEVTEREPLPEPEPIHFEPIEDLDLSLFDNQMLENLDSSAADDLFDPDKLAEIANETRRERGPLSYDEARELGIIP